MKARGKIILTGVIVIAFVLLPCLSIAGSLEPAPDAVDLSGNPVPTMKTLDQIPPTWSRKLPCTSPTNCPRFEVLSDFNNEAVLDKETGLVWRRSPRNYQGNWWHAKNTCLAGCLGGRCGWRVPTIYEFQSLAAYTPECGILPCGHPFIDANGCWWSSTDSPFDFNEAVYFCNTAIGGGWSYSGKTGEYFGSWCVRGGLGVDDSITFRY